LQGWKRQQYQQDSLTIPQVGQIDEGVSNMNNRVPCFSDSSENRFPDTDGPELERPVWIKTKDCMSAVELSAKVDPESLCRMWASWRDSTHLIWILHGFLMLTSLRYTDAAWREIQFLHNLIETEGEQ
jgi:hypothetical protein